jgi:formylglycine-generating enzyme required for sulfatase activity
MGRQPKEALRERVLEQLLTHFQGETLCQEAGAALVEMWGGRMVAELRERQVPLALLEQAMGLTMVHIPAGTFLYGDKKKQIELPQFWIDKTPVTNTEYKRFLDANPDHPVPFVDQGWGESYNWDRQSRTFPPDKAGHPVVLVSWHDAVAYAGWAGKRLPTEEEWEKAARGTDGREYPWGDQQPTPDLCNFGGNVDGTTPVGRYSPQGDSPYGCVDMAGNVWEWTASDYGKSSKVLRGGAWYYDWIYVRAAYRTHSTPDSRVSNMGFRCVGLPGG